MREPTADELARMRTYESQLGLYLFSAMDDAWPREPQPDFRLGAMCPSARTELRASAETAARRGNAAARSDAIAALKVDATARVLTRETAGRPHIW